MMDLVRTEEFPLNELIHWLGIIEGRWQFDDHKVTLKRSGGVLAIFQDGKYRAGLELDGRPTISGWADDDA